LSSLGGQSLVLKYNGSPSLLLAAVYPEHDWLPWKFDKCPQKYWDNVNNKRKFMDWAATQLNVKEMNDWYSVSLKVQEIFRKFPIISEITRR
jgi:hypothetical protein